MSVLVAQLRREICRVGKSLFERGYVHATAGNISVKLPASEGGGVLITPTDACLGFLDPDSLALVDASGTHVGGEKPSKTIALHRRIYEACEKKSRPTGCIVHTHSTHCVALSLRAPLQISLDGEFADFLPPITPYFVMKVGHVPLIPYAAPGATQAVDWVAKAIDSQPICAVMLERLGPVVWQDNPAKAMAALEELEETAKLAWMSSSATEPLTAIQISELIDAFGIRW